MIYKFFEFLEYYKTLRIYEQATHLIQIGPCFRAFPIFQNVESARDRFHCANGLVVLRMRAL